MHTLRLLFLAILRVFIEHLSHEITYSAETQQSVLTFASTPTSNVYTCIFQLFLYYAEGGG